MPPLTKPKPPCRLAGLARKVVRFGKLRSAARSPVTAGDYQRLPAATIKYTWMKKAFKTLALAIVIVTACLAVHYAIGTFSY